MLGRTGIKYIGVGGTKLYKHLLKIKHPVASLMPGTLMRETMKPMVLCRSDVPPLSIYGFIASRMGLARVKFLRATVPVSDLDNEDISLSRLGEGAQEATIRNHGAAFRL